MEESNFNIDSIIVDLKSISCIMDEDEIYTQHPTEQFKIDIDPQEIMIKVIISHERWNRSYSKEWTEFTKFIRSTELFKEYYEKVKVISRKHGGRAYISKIDGLEIRIVKK